MKKSLLKICKEIDDYEKSRSEQNNNGDLLFISFRDDGVYLNDIKVIDKRAKLQIEILKLLFLEQTKSALNNSKKFGSTWYELASELESITRKNMTEQYIRQSIHEIRMKIKSVPKNRNVRIIEISNHRYFLNAKIVLKTHRNM